MTQIFDKKKLENLWVVVVFLKDKNHKWLNHEEELWIKKHVKDLRRREKSKNDTIEQIIMIDCVSALFE